MDTPLEKSTTPNPNPWRSFGRYTGFLTPGLLGAAVSTTLDRS